MKENFRNKIKVSICIVLLLNVCCTREICRECNFPLGKLLLSASNVEWGRIQLEDNYIRTIKFFNPLHRGVQLKIKNECPELDVRMIGNLSLDLKKDGFRIESREYVTIQIAISPKDSSLIGEYNEDIYIVVDGKMLFLPIKQHAIITENFNSDSIDGVTDRPVLFVEKDTFDFRIIGNEERVSAKFMIKNIGKRNLIIRKTETSCGCTGASLEKNVVLSGDSVALQVWFNSLGRQGKQYNYVRIFCNDPKYPVKEFTLRGFVY